MSSAVPHPPITEVEGWLSARKKLLGHEKQLTALYDKVAAERRWLSMEIDKEYSFDGSAGTVGLIDLFCGKRQLIIYHFMFDPDWETGCSGCSGYADALGDLSLLERNDTSFAFVSRAPFKKIEAYRALKGWSVPWYSSFGSDFNYDFHVTLDEAVPPVIYNYRSWAEIETTNTAGATALEGEEHAISVFFQLDHDIYHTYSTFARGTEGLTDAYRLLDTTPYGRQQDFEESPTGWPQKPTYGK